MRDVNKSKNDKQDQNQCELKCDHAFISTKPQERQVQHSPFLATAHQRSSEVGKEGIKLHVSGDLSQACEISSPPYPACVYEDSKVSKTKVA